MRRKSTAVFTVFITAILLLCVTTGCNRHPEDSGLSNFRVVTAVTVYYDNGPINAQRHYTTDSKMQKILDYLRLINPYGVPNEDPETAVGSDFYIVLSYSDGFQKTYRQKGDRFLQGSDGLWKKIDPAKAEEFGRIVGQLESDRAL